MASRIERVFMVRMWLPDAAQERTEWRGSVRDVSAGRTYYIVGTRDIADYIAGALQNATANAPSHPVRDETCEEA